MAEKMQQHRGMTIRALLSVQVIAAEDRMLILRKLARIMKALNHTPSSMTTVVFQRNKQNERLSTYIWVAMHSNATNTLQNTPAMISEPYEALSLIVTNFESV